MAKRLTRRVHAPNGLTEKEHDKHMSYCPIPGERVMEKKRLKWLEELLQAGEFNRVDWAYCLCKEDGKWYRVNGQTTGHQLDRVRKGEIEAAFPEGIPTELQYWECDRVVELADVFDQFDSHHSVRKPKDKLGIFQSQHEDVQTVSRELSGQILAGIEWGCRHNEIIAERIPAAYRPSGAYERGQMLNVSEVRDFILFVADNQEGTFYKEWLSRTGLVAFFFSAFLEKPEKARRLIEFFIYEVPGTPAAEFAKWTRKETRKTGIDAGKFFRQAKDSMSKLNRELGKLSTEEVENMLDEAKEGEPEEAVS